MASECRLTCVRRLWTALGLIVIASVAEAKPVPEQSAFVTVDDEPQDVPPRGVPAPPAQAGEKPGPEAGRDGGVPTIALPALVPWGQAWTDEKLLGLPKGREFDVLRLEDAYAIALIDARSGKPGSAFEGAARLVPATLAGLRARYETADFGRFREELLTVPRGDDAARAGFRDPSGTYLKVLALAFSAREQSRAVEQLESLVRTLAAVVAGGGSSFNEVDVDRAKDELLRHRQELEATLQIYGNTRDELNARLGLPPNMVLVTDSRLLASIVDTFEEVQVWFLRSDRDPSELGPLVDRLPQPRDAALGKVSLLSRDAELESVLEAAETLALANRRKRATKTRPEESERQLAMRVRRRIRALRKTAEDYRLETRRLHLSLRQVDDGSRRVLLPPNPGNEQDMLRTGMTMVTAGTVAIARQEQRIVMLWTEYLAERAALDRDLGVLPYDTWDGFLAQFRSPPGSEKRP